jgi:hypothetical protein
LRWSTQIFFFTVFNIDFRFPGIIYTYVWSIIIFDMMSTLALVSDLVSTTRVEEYYSCDGKEAREYCSNMGVLTLQ